MNFSVFAVVQEIYTKGCKYTSHSEEKIESLKLIGTFWNVASVCVCEDVAVNP